MALIPLGSGRLADDPDTRGNAMRHQNSVFHEVLKQVLWGEFERLVEVRRADWRVRRLPTKSQLLAMIYAQVAGPTSPCQIVNGKAKQAIRPYHLGPELPNRSTFADAH